MKKEYKITSILYIIASIFFFISAILEFSNKNNMAVVHLCLGACFLTLSLVHYSEYKKSQEKEIKDSKENKEDEQ